MSEHPSFPDLSGTEPTRDTIRAYSQVLGAVRRAHAPPHPRWWHVSLEVGQDALLALPMPWPDRPDASFAIDLDLRVHQLTVKVADEVVPGSSLQEGLSASALGDRLLHILHGAGIDAQPAREKYADDDVRIYDPAAAVSWLRVFHAAQSTLRAARNGLSGECGPVQLWPHHFDLAFEWFGTRRVEYVEDGEQREASSQIGFGFSGIPSDHAPGPYFYATPWPFEQDFTAIDLPGAAVWMTEGWEGALLPYADARAGGSSVVGEFCRVVYDGCAPRLA